MNLEELNAHHVTKALEELVISWGGLIQYVSWEEELPNASAAPFSSFLSVDHEAKLIYVRGPLDSEEAGGLIHECAHVFACEVHPTQSVEFNFMGWEFVVARKVGMLEAWLESMRLYTIVYLEDTGFESTFSELSPDLQSDVIEERVLHAMHLGLLTADGEPLSIRKD